MTSIIRKGDIGEKKDCKRQPLAVFSEKVSPLKPFRRGASPISPLYVAPPGLEPGSMV